MPDLHEWIGQQIDEREQLADLISPGGYAPDEWRTEPSRSGRWTQIVAYSRTNIEPPEAAVREGGQPVALVQTGRNEHLLIAMHGPASVLRRCAADRKILAEHKPMGGGYPYHYVCEGCGYDGADYCSEPMTGHVNDCPTLLALAEGYGITDEQRAALDRLEPEPPARNAAADGGFLVPNEIVNAYSKALTEMVLNRRPIEPKLHVKVVGPGIAMPEWLREDLGLPAAVPEPTPEEKALEVLEPELKKIPGYVAADPLPRPLSEHCRPGRCLGLTCCSYECSQGRCPSIPEEFRKTTP